MDTDKPFKDASPWHPMTDTVALKHLGKLAEELGEATAAVSRCVIQGIDEKEPETGVVNRVWLENELSDVMANIQLVTDHFGLDIPRMVRRSERKKTHLQGWHKLA